MGNRKSQKKSWASALVLVLLCLPNIFLLAYRLAQGDIGRLAGSFFLLICSVAFILLIPALFRLKIKRYFYSISPLILLVPLVIYNISVNGQFPNHWLLLTTWYDAFDAIELMKDNVLLLLVIPLFFFSYLFFVKKFISKEERISGPFLRFGIIGFCLFVFIYDFVQAKNKSLALSVQLEDRIDLVFPWGILNDFNECRQEINFLDARENEIQGFSYDAEQSEAAPEKEIYVLIIGETARYQNWALNGYHRETNPELAKLSKLLVYSNVNSSASTTFQSIPLMLTGVAPDNFHGVFKKRSFITAFKEAGFKTYWLSNLHRFGEHDTNTSIYADEADVIIYNEELEEGESHRLDESLLRLMHGALEDSSPKKLIILHTLGSHFIYNRRYTETFDHFTPSGKNDPSRTSFTKEELINSYDNSIRYTDAFVNDVVDLCKLSKQASFVYYISDHGENLKDNAANLHLHGIGNYWDLHIPQFIWLSDEYRLSHPRKSQALEANEELAHSLEGLFHSICDMADLKFEGMNKKRSLASDQYETWKRKAVTIDDRLVSYDEMIPKQ